MAPGNPSSRVAPADLGCMAALWLALAVAIPTLADPDLWGHVRFGQMIAAARALPAADPFSFTSDRAWINHEWLAEVVMAAAFDGRGAAGLAGLKAGLVILAMGLAAWVLRPSTAGGWAAPGALLFVGLAGVFPLATTLRPQVFSVVFTVAELAILVAALSRPACLWALPPLFAIWANCHGGWLVGGGVLAVWAGMRAVDRDTSLPERRTLAAVGPASAVATLATPYGFDLWRFLWQTVGLARTDIPEWGSLIDRPELIAPWLITAVIAGVAAGRAGRRGRPGLAVALLLAALSAMVGRLVPVFSLAVGLGVVPVAVQAAVIGPGSRRSLPWHLALVLVSATLALAQNLALGPGLACIPTAPALVLDPAAGAFLAANHLRGRLAVWFDWGEYAIWQRGPQLRVSIDGRRETVYSDRVLAGHQALYAGTSAARAYIEELSPDYVWLPRDFPVAPSLDRWGYRRIFESRESILWTAAADRRHYQAAGAPGPACFPGP